MEASSHQAAAGPNNVSIITKLYGTCIALVTLPPVIFMVVLSHGFQRGRLTLKERIKRATIRSVLATIPLPLLRQPDLARISRVLDSPRFRSVKDELLTPVQKPDFSGYWICQNSIAKREAPRHSDVVILFSHGGGYVMGDMSTYLTFLLRLAESVEDRGFTVSIFMLEYSYAPEHPFPAQLEQMIAAYRYVTEEEGVNPGKIALAGDSAGGNLLLSFLTCLHSPLLPSWLKFSGPFLGLFLMSPWLGFSHSGSSFEANADLDCLRKSSLDTWASCFRAGSSLDPATIRAYTDFEGEDENRPSMATILTKRIAITAGGDELMVSSITSFADCAKKAGIEVSLDIAPGMVHDWQMIQSRNDEAGYLQILRSDSAKPHLDGAVEFGRLIVECMQAG